MSLLQVQLQLQSLEYVGNTLQLQSAIYEDLDANFVGYFVAMNELSREGSSLIIYSFFYGCDVSLSGSEKFLL